jgi:mannose-6-phosphate isomerase-like protein (cupin superfamily)
MRKIALALLVTATAHAPTLAQDGAHPPGDFKTAAEIETALTESTPALGIVAGQATELVSTANGQIVIRRRQSGPNNASIHQDVTETYYIVSGAGTFVMGGTVTDPENRTAGITGGVAQHVSAGDFIVLPPGTAHWFREIEGEITYVETRLAVE